MTSPKSSRPLCSVDGCSSAVKAWSWCNLHYRRWMRTGDVQAHKPERRYLTFDERVDKSGGEDACWIWQGSTNTDGYGQVKHGGRNLRAHRFSYELHRGPIPEGLLVCHTCDNPPCVNPAHLFLGTHADNHKDRDSKGRHYEAKMTHCKRGHPLEGENLYRQPSNPNMRKCKACLRLRKRKDWKGTPAK